MRRNRRLICEQGGKNRASQEDSTGGRLAACSNSDGVLTSGGGLKPTTAIFAGSSLPGSNRHDFSRRLRFPTRNAVQRVVAIGGHQPARDYVLRVYILRQPVGLNYLCGETQ